MALELNSFIDKSLGDGKYLTVNEDAIRVGSKTGMGLSTADFWYNTSI